MIKIGELKIDEEYKEILEDIQTECAKFGKVMKVVIPRPIKDKNVVGLGKAFI